MSRAEGLTATIGRRWRNAKRSRALGKRERTVGKTAPGRVHVAPAKDVLPRNRAEWRAAGLRASAGGRYSVYGMRLRPETAAAARCPVLPGSLVNGGKS